MKIVLFVLLGLFVWLGIVPALLAIPKDSKFTTYPSRLEFFFYACVFVLLVPFMPFMPLVGVLWSAYLSIKRKILKYPKFEDFERNGRTFTFTGNPNIICNCLSSGKCEQYPYRDNTCSNPFIDVGGEKICTRVWKEK